MNRLTRPLNSVTSTKLLRSLSLHSSFSKSPLRFSRAIRPPPNVKQLTLSPLQFSHFASIANHPNIKPELLSINPSGDDGSSNETSDSSERRNAELPEELSKRVTVLSCESSAEGGTCNVYLVGTAHVSEESFREVEAVISCLKPQVVFLELCQGRASALTRKSLKVPTTEEMIEMWKKNHDMLSILLTRSYAKVGSWLGVVPGSEFRVAYEEAKKYGGKVVFGDRPIHITLRRIRENVSLWEAMKLLYLVLSQSADSSQTSDHLKKMLKELDDVDKVAQLIQEMSKKFPSLVKTLVDERDHLLKPAYTFKFMSSALLKVASKHRSVVAVVGRGHVDGIRKYWKKPISLDDLMTIPSPKPKVSTGKILGISVAIISGIYLASKM